MILIRLVLNAIWRVGAVLGALVATGLIIGAGNEQLPGMAYATPTLVTSATPGAPRVVVFGDSTAEFLGRAMIGLDVTVTNFGLRRCPFRPDVHAAEILQGAGLEVLATAPEGARTGESCGWTDYMRDARDAVDGATVVLFAAPMMVVDFDDGNILDVRFRVTLHRELDAWLDLMMAWGAERVVLVQPPRSRAHEDLGGRWWLDDDRHAAWLQLLGLLDETHPSVCLVDYEAWAATQPDPRVDGSHMEGPAATEAAGWIIDERNCA